MVGQASSKAKLSYWFLPSELDCSHLSPLWPPAKSSNCTAPSIASQNTHTALLAWAGICSTLLSAAPRVSRPSNSFGICVRSKSSAGVIRLRHTMSWKCGDWGTWTESGYSGPEAGWGCTSLRCKRGTCPTTAENCEKLSHHGTTPASLVAGTFILQPLGNKFTKGWGWREWTWWNKVRGMPYF